MEKVVRQIQGGAGPEGSEWQNYLLRYGAYICVGCNSRVS